jgi:hypothetical protein
MPVKGPEKYTAKYWHDQITNAEERYKKFCEQAKQSIEVYNTKKKIDEVERRINCWWSLVNTLLPAYYSSTPKAQVELKKKAGSQIHSLAAVALERATQWEMDEGFDFDQGGLDAALHFLLTGLGVLWARYDAKIQKKELEITLIRGQSGLVMADGKPYTGGESEVKEKEDGSLYCCEEYEAKENEAAILELINFDDFRCSDARNASEIEWKARRAWLCEEEATEIFGPDIAKDLSYDSFPESFKRDPNSGKRDEYNGKAELWEIHCEESGKVYWLQAKGEKSVLQSDTPKLKFEDFYPCVEIRASTDPLSVVPVSDYEHCKDQILLCERLTTRKHALIQSIRTNFGYDATVPELGDFFNGDLKGIPVKNWPSYKSRGGLASSMEFQDPTPYVQALAVITEQEREAWDKLCEMTKCSDLLRGQTDPNKTATANRLENAWSSLGLIVRQNQFANFIGRAVGKLGTVIAQAYSPERISDISDLKGLVAPLAENDPMKAQAIEQQVLAVIKNDVESAYRIEIASDSMVALNERQERQDAVDLVQSAGAFFQQMQQMVEQYPPMVTLGIELFQFIVRRYRGGKELEPIFIDALQKVGAMAQQKQEAAQQQPPDPAMIAAQTQMQIAQMDGQTAYMKAQTDIQLAQMKDQREAAAQQFEQVVRSRELELEAQKVSVSMMEVQAKIAQGQQQLELESQKANTQTAKDMLQMQVDKHMQQVDAMIRQQEANTKELAAKMQAWEKLQEERRLAQVELGQKKERERPIQIINQIPAPKNKKITKLKNADGSETYKSEEADD